MPLLHNIQSSFLNLTILLGLASCGLQLSQGGPKTPRSESDSSFVSGGQAVSLGYGTNCLVQDEALKCWGKMFYCSNGECITESDPASRTLHTVRSSNVHSVSVGANGICYVTVDQKLRCWGSNEYGELGSGETFSGYATGEREVFSTKVQALSFRNRHACAIVADALYCWGQNNYGQIGNGQSGNSVSSPYKVFDSGVTAVSVGNHHSCAQVDGSLYCWGANWDGQIGNGQREDRVPTPYKVLDGEIEKISLGYSYSCVVQGGKLSCWGATWNGAVGNGVALDQDRAYALSPVEIIASGVTDIATSNALTCAVASGDLRCWGTAESLFPNFSLPETNASPQRIMAASATSWVSTGLNHLCLGDQGELTCFGDSLWEQAL